MAHATLLRPLLQNGDSAVYNQQIEGVDLTHRTTHIGYVAMGILFNELLPFGTDLNMNVMVLVVGFAGLVAVYATATHLGASRLPALGSVVVALGLASQVRGMLLSEVDGVSVAFFALSFACFQRCASWAAGVLFGFSLLVTPLSGPLLVVFLLVAAVKAVGSHAALGEQVRRLVKFGTGAVLVYVPPVLVVYQDYVHGPRGLLHAPRAALTVPQRVAFSWHFITSELGYMIPLYVMGAIVCLASPRLWRAGQPALALLISIVLMAVVGERFRDVPVQLPNLVLLGILPAIAYGISGRFVRIGLVLLFAVCFSNIQRSYASAQEDLRSRERDRQLCLDIRVQSGPRAPVLVGISGWHQSRVFEHFASSPHRPARALEWGPFVNDQARWLDPAEQTQIWFFRGVRPAQVRPLLSHYSLESRTSNNRKFKVLVPLPSTATSGG